MKKIQLVVEVEYTDEEDLRLAIGSIDSGEGIRVIRRLTKPQEGASRYRMTEAEWAGGGIACQGEQW